MAAPSPLAHAEPLPRLGFAVESAAAVRYAAAPTIAFSLALESDRPVRSLSLNAQLRIVPGRRAYDAGDEERLVELFGTPERWGDTLRGFLWTNATLVVPAFTGETRVELTVPCTYDLEVAAAKYFHALRDGDVPLELLFSGTVFFLGDGGLLRTARISWESEAPFRLPVRVWKEAIENHFPGSAWLRVRRDVFDRLVEYKASRTLPTWEATIEELLARVSGSESSVQDDGSSTGRPGRPRGKDAGSVNSSAIGATEDAASRRPGRSGDSALRLESSSKPLTPDGRR